MFQVFQADCLLSVLCYHMEHLRFGHTVVSCLSCHTVRVWLVKQFGTVRFSWPKNRYKLGVFNPTSSNETQLHNQWQLASHTGVRY